MEKLLLVRPDLSYEIVECEQEDIFAKARELLPCSWVEDVHIFSSPSHFDFDLLIDELGKLYEVPLIFNPFGSFYYLGTEFGDPIVGSVIVCRRHKINRFGEEDIFGLTAKEICFFINEIDCLRSNNRNV